MTYASLAWLAATVSVFIGANSVLRAYVGSGQWAVLAGALVLFCVGNLMMIRVMRDSGLGLAVALSSVVQLVAIAVVAFAVFGERPTGLQMAGMALGVVAVAMIGWPQGGRG